MTRKKMLPLALLAAVVVLLAVLLAALHSAAEEEELPGIALCPLTAAELDTVSYSGENVEVTLQKGSGGTWRLASDPSLPLDQEDVAALVDQYAALRADRQLQGDELAEIPARSETPLMIFTLTGGEMTRTLTVDCANDVAEIYYLYDETGAAYTIPQDDLIGLCKAPRDLYEPQTLTDKTADDVAEMEVGALTFTHTDGEWTLDGEPDYPLDQDAVQKMANTLCNLQTEWTITAPEDGGYGLTHPDVVAVLSFTDGTALTVRFGNETPGDDGACYLRASSDPSVVYEVNADHKNAFAVTKQSLYDAEATAETAAED